MKKLIIICFLFALALSCAGCGGAQLASLCLRPKKGTKKHPVRILGCIAATVLIALGLNALFPGENVLIEDGFVLIPAGSGLADDVSAWLTKNGIEKRPS